MATQQLPRGRPPRFQHCTGLDDEQLSDLVAAVHAVIGPWQKPRGRRRALGLYMAVVVVLFYLRRNNSQAVEAELFGCSQPTVSRYLTVLEQVIGRCLEALEAEAAADRAHSTLIVDGFLVPTGERAQTKGLFSGKRHACGVNVQAVADLRGHLVDFGEPMLGSMHDARAFTESGIAKRYAAHAEPGGPGLIGDKGYVGCGIITPVKKPYYRPLTAAEGWFNRQINRRRSAGERAIAHAVNWKILDTGYRRPLRLLGRTLRCVLGLEIYRRQGFNPFE